MYEQWLHNFQENFQERWTVPKSMTVSGLSDDCSALGKWAPVLEEKAYHYKQY